MRLSPVERAERFRDVMALTATGITLDQVAQQLGITRSAVRAEIARAGLTTAQARGIRCTHCRRHVERARPGRPSYSCGLPECNAAERRLRAERARD